MISISIWQQQNYYQPIWIQRNHHRHLSRVICHMSYAIRHLSSPILPNILFAIGSAALSAIFFPMRSRHLCRHLCRLLCRHLRRGGVGLEHIIATRMTYSIWSYDDMRHFIKWVGYVIMKNKKTELSKSEKPYLLKLRFDSWPSDQYFDPRTTELPKTRKQIIQWG